MDEPTAEARANAQRLNASLEGHRGYGLRLARPTARYPESVRVMMWSPREQVYDEHWFPTGYNPAVDRDLRALCYDR
ncbi:MAG: hypothetical protein A2Y38_24800 [Spirochaetes bacterium GWB1_59_5]|nr:MAG: hypothetical protein A2Y38_24800 [Spirochaetes bacterium GWB1_59_5]